MRQEKKKKKTETDIIRSMGRIFFESMISCHAVSLSYNKDYEKSCFIKQAKYMTLWGVLAGPVTLNSTVFLSHMKADQTYWSLFPARDIVHAAYHLSFHPSFHLSAAIYRDISDSKSYWYSFLCIFLKLDRPLENLVGLWEKWKGPSILIVHARALMLESHQSLCCS